MKNFSTFLNEANRLKIMSDVDGVILDFTGGFKNWMANEHQLAIDVTRWDFGMNNVWDYIKIYWASGAMENLKQYPGAKTAFNKLAKKFDIHIVTALDAKYKADRIKNLLGFDYKSITIKGQGKLEHILNVTKPDIAFEDKPEYIMKMSQSGIDVYYPDLPLTKTLTMGTKYKSWSHLLKLITRKYNVK